MYRCEINARWYWVGLSFLNWIFTLHFRLMCSNSVPAQRSVIVSSYLFVFVHGNGSKTTTCGCILLHDNMPSTAEIWRNVFHFCKKDAFKYWHMLTDKSSSFFFMRSWIASRNQFHLNISKTNNLTVSRHRKVRAVMCESPTNNSLACDRKEKKKKERELLDSVPGICFRFCQKLSSFQWAIPV